VRAGHKARRVYRLSVPVPDGLVLMMHALRVDGKPVRQTAVSGGP
jgi:hypothetical protein